MVLSFRKLSTE